MPTIEIILDPIFPVGQGSPKGLKRFQATGLHPRQPVRQTLLGGGPIGRLEPLAKIFFQVVTLFEFEGHGQHRVQALPFVIIQVFAIPDQ
jgi:hypothetical protein